MRHIVDVYSDRRMVISYRFRPRFWFIKWTKLYKGTTQPATPAMWKTSSPSASPASNRQTEDPPEEVEVAQTEIPEEDNVATPPTTPIDMNAEASRKRANFISQLKARESLRGRDNRGNLSEDEDRFKSRAAFWGPFFFEHFVNSDPNEGVKGEEDDCVYFVNKYDPTNKATDRFSVRRKGGKNVFPQVKFFGRHIFHLNHVEGERSVNRMGGVLFLQHDPHEL